jgi:cell division protein FtsA
MTARAPHRSTVSSAPSATALLDVGTSKVGCLVIGADGRLLGGAHAVSAGLRSAEVFDSAAAVAVIDRTFAQAQQAAAVPIDELVLAVGGARLSSRLVQAGVTLDPPIVCDPDVDRLDRALGDALDHHGLVRLHAEPHPYRLDGVETTVAPRAQFGRQLEAVATLVGADPRPLEALVTAIETAGRTVTRLVPAPLAAAWAVTTPAERLAGITVIDAGAGQTSYAMFAQGRLVAAGMLALGGNQMTAEIAAALQLPTSEAERIKTNYAMSDLAPIAEAAPLPRAWTDGSDTERSQFAARVLRSDDQVRALLRHVIDRRVDLWLRLLSDRIDAETYALAGARRVVLTGGAAGLAGLADRAQTVWGRPVEVRGAIGDTVPEPLRGPAWAVLAGLRMLGGDATAGVRIAWGGASSLDRRATA